MSQQPQLKWPGAKVRQTFVDYFVDKCQHTHVVSAPVVPLRDPTILFVNAGMVQFKSLFLGTADPNTDFGKMRRAVDSQLCIRAGGKHNDLDDVGRDTYHHTFFEMLGNWAFNGDYFKKEAIEWAWDLLTNVYGINKDRLYVTYFEGNKELGLEPDHETRDLWRKFVPNERILTGNMKDNFWEMGDTGPCGPCTEIHFDKIGNRDASGLVNKDDESVIEVWNLVFMQFNRAEKGGALTPLPAVHVDAGMGLERLTALLQGKTSNYDTDLWSGIFEKIQEVTKCPRSFAEATKDERTAYCVVADHARCLTVALSDGATPDSIGRGFVLRRIIRRAIRFGVEFLKAETGFFHQLVPAVVESLGPFFTHMQAENTQRRVSTLLKDEEESFAKTWKTGLKHFEDAKAAAVAKKSKEIAAKDVFILHDRYGFPMDLTTLLAEREEMTVDPKKFQEEMKKAQTSGGRVAAARTFFDAYQVDSLQQKKIPPTDDSSKYQWKPASGKILAIFDRHGGAFMDEVTKAEAAQLPKESVGIVFDTTNFYFECGGQIYDTGVIEQAQSNAVFHVTKVYSFGGYIVHIGNLEQGSLEVGQTCGQAVNYTRRKPIAANHTATHQVNHALREVLQFGHPEAFTEVNQRGSLVTEENLRFDFSWNSKLTSDDIANVEKLMNGAIKEDLKVYSQLVPLKDALAINSIRCMFDEKYPDPCTVVSVGASIDEMVKDPKNEKWKQYSVELCGGTHLTSLGECESAVAVGEEALQKGVRRLTMLTREAARKAHGEADAVEAEFNAIQAKKDADSTEREKLFKVLLKKVNDNELPLVRKFKLRDEIDAAVTAEVAAQKAKASALKALATTMGAEWGASHPKDERVSIVCCSELGADNDALQAAIDRFVTAQPDVAVFVIGEDKAKKSAQAIATLPKAFTDKKLSAIDWIKAVCGKGGGKPGTAKMVVKDPDVNALAAAAKKAGAEMVGKL